MQLLSATSTKTHGLAQSSFLSEVTRMFEGSFTSPLTLTLYKRYKRNGAGNEGTTKEADAIQSIFHEVQTVSSLFRLYLPNGHAAERIG